MGLDIIEFIGDIEQHFGIEIPNAAVARLTTPGLVIEYLCNHLMVRDQGTDACETQHTFYQLRQILGAQTGIGKAQLHPSVPVMSVLPASHRERRRVWFVLRNEVKEGVHPKLSLPWYLSTLLYGITISLGIFMAAYLIRNGVNHGLVAVAALGVFIFSAIVGYYVSRPWRTMVPDWYTLRDLARILQASQEKQVISEPGWTRSQIASHVRAIAENRFGISVFRDDSRFVEDLRVD